MYRALVALALFIALLAASNGKNFVKQMEEPPVLLKTLAAGIAPNHIHQARVSNDNGEATPPRVIISGPPKDDRIRVWNWRVVDDFCERDGTEDFGKSMKTICKCKTIYYNKDASAHGREPSLGWNLNGKATGGVSWKDGTWRDTHLSYIASDVCVPGPCCK